MKSEFEVAFNEISQLRELSRDVVLDALRTALVSAYKRDVGLQSQHVEVNIDPNSGRTRIFVEKEVVDDVQDDRTEVLLENARYFDQNANYGDMVMVQLEGSTKRFGRIAAQTAKQVVLQKIREAERKTLLDEYKDREGDLVHGTVQSINGGVVTISLGRAEAIMPKKEQIPSEKIKPHDKVRAYIVKVEDTNRGPQIVVSRSHRNMLRRLLEYEVPEIFNGQVEIKNIAREAGGRSKVAVAALQEGIDPVGACVGQRGIRIQNIVTELHEKIDVIEWSPNHESFIAKALSPARVSGVYLNDDPDEGRTALVIVPEDQLSLAIGREGQNARLAAKLTGWRIDIKSVPEAVIEALEAIDRPPLNTISDQYPEMVNDVRRIMAKREMAKTVMAEEFNALAKFADLVQRRIQQVQEQRRKDRLAEIAAVKSTLPAAAFHMSVDQLELPDAVIDTLRPFNNVGEVMLRFLVDEARIKNALRDAPANALKQLQDALDRLIIPQEAYAAAEAEELAAQQAAEAAAAAEAGEEDHAALEAGLSADDGHQPQTEPARGKRPSIGAAQEAEPDFAPTFQDADDPTDLTGKKKGKKKKGRQLIYDEDRGGMVVKRQRKHGRSDWEEWDE
ncbi:MAG: transcription termination factor NusA [Anaerolineae bacterium]|nr:transcription termination factor NusA [Anaerolineae bacterium]NUQ04713.1 transcription termination/antitermination protein NusA [Anaerolineae bacterium]